MVNVRVCLTRPQTRVQAFTQGYVRSTQSCLTRHQHNTLECVLCRHKVIESVCTVVVYNTVRTAMIIFSFILLTLEIARKN